MRSVFAELRQAATPRAVGRNARRYSRHAAQLLKFFAMHRTALANHVQRQFQELLPTDRTTRLHLQTLVAHGDLGIVHERGLGQPNVYQITSRGLQCAAEHAGIDVKANRRQPTGAHAVHELLITEFAVSLAEMARQQRQLTIPWDHRFGLVNHAAFQHLVPDYAFLLKHSSGMLVCLVEVSSGEESPTRIGQKLAKYAEWSANPATAEFLLSTYRAHGAVNPQAHFRLLIVAHNRRTGHDETRLKQILRECAELNRSMVARTWVTTVERLAQPRGLAGPVWTAAEDVASRIADWNDIGADTRRKRIPAVLSCLPAHRLVPREGGR